MSDAAAPSSRRLLDATVVVALCAAGAAWRAPGLTKADLWFDDAWAALPAHEPLSTALRMLVTAPGYELVLRQWIRFGNATTWWDQLPALVLGVAGIAAVYGLVRGLRYPRLAALAAGACIAAGPVTIEYSTRLKEYPSDLLCACLVLWLAERWRRDPNAANLWELAGAGVLSLWLSASVAPVVGGAAVMVAVAAVRRAELRNDAVRLVAALGIAAVALWAIVLRHVPAQLRTNWQTHGYLFGYSSLHHVAYTFQQTFSGLPHGLLAIPIPWTASASAIAFYPMAVAILCAAGICALVARSAVATWRDRAPSVALASGAAVALAVAGTFLGIAPLGDGRTDEMLYPALLVLLVDAAVAVGRSATGTLAIRRATQWVLAVAVVGVGAVTGTTHEAAYPPTGLATVLSELRKVMLPGDVVLLDGYESFTWADDTASGWKVSFSQGAVPWPMGYHVVSTTHDVVTSNEYLQADRQIRALSTVTRRVWYVGPTIGGYSTDAPRDLWPFPDDTPVYELLPQLGWHPASPFVCCHSPGVFAELFVYRNG